MDRQQVTLLAVMTGAFLLMVLVAFMVGGIQSSGDRIVASSPISTDKPLKKLRAKPGTQRKNARALLSSRKEAPEDPYLASKQDEPLRIWGSLDRNEPWEASVPRDLLLDRSSPAEALEMITASLDETGEDSLSGTEKYAALGYVLTRQVPLDEKAVEEAFQKAKRMLAGDDDLHAYLYYRCKAWLARGQYRAMHDELVKHSPEWLRPGARSLEIGIMRAFAEEHLEQEADAEMAYRWVLEATQSWQCLDEPRCEGVYRQAARRLARLYRIQGLEEEAIATTERMRVALDTIPGTA